MLEYTTGTLLEVVNWVGHSNELSVMFRYSSVRFRYSSVRFHI